MSKYASFWELGTKGSKSERFLMHKANPPKYDAQRLNDFFKTKNHSTLNVTFEPNIKLKFERTSLVKFIVLFFPICEQTQVFL